MIKIDLELYNQEVDKEFVSCRKHPELPLWVWCYTNKCVKLNIWEDIHIQARGIITDKDGVVVAKSFDKFFNYERTFTSNSRENYSKYKVYKKYDGSLGTIFFYEDKWRMATKGSFDSIQALYAMKSLLPKYDIGKLNRDYSYAVEIIYPQNRIVVDYRGLQELRLLAIFDKNKDFKEIGIEECNVFPVVEELDTTNINDINLLYDLNIENEEGYVLKTTDGIRYKIKFDKYLKIHKLISNLNVKNIIDLFIENGVKKATVKIQEIKSFLYKDDKITLEAMEQKITRACLVDIPEKIIAIFLDAIDTTGKPSEKNRKNFALQVKGDDYSGILFSMYENNIGKDLPNVYIDNKEVFKKYKQIVKNSE